MASLTRAESLAAIGEWRTELSAGRRELSDEITALTHRAAVLESESGALYDVCFVPDTLDASQLALLTLMDRRTFGDRRHSALRLLLDDAINMLAGVAPGAA